MLSENTIELRKTVKSAGSGCFSDWDLCIDQHCLHISDSCHLDIVSNREARYTFKLMGKIAVADSKSL
jgi:hypothetical protein